LHEIYSDRGRKGIALESGFKCLLIQYWEDLSDRQLERYVRENMVMRWFCGYKLTERTPDHSFYGKLRKRIGVERLSELFNEILKKLEEQGYIGNIFHFVDASSLISKINIWTARDKAIRDKENKERDENGNKKLNNKNVSKYSSDKEAKFGCKGNKNFWFGYKRHNRVDMRQGIITKVEVTDASVPDSKAFVEKDLCPERGMVFMDKGYDTEAVYKKLEDAFGDNDNVEFRYYNYPLESIHRYAYAGALAIECAGKVGGDNARLLYHDLVFDDVKQKLSTKFFRDLIENKDLSFSKEQKEQFLLCLNNKQTSGVIKAHKKEGDLRGLKGTPTLYISGEEYNGRRTYDALFIEVNKQLSRMLNK